METTTKSISESVIEGLKKAIAELEEFRLQFALGKVEATDKYEETKKSLNEFIHDIKTKLGESKELTTELKAKLEELMLQLALGKTETKDAFIEQKKKISKVVQEIESIIKNYPLSIKVQSKLNIEIEKFNIKMEMLYLHFSLGKLDAKEKFESKKSDFLKMVEDLKKGFAKHEPDIKENWERFTDEMNKAYTHLKNAFIKP